MSWDFGLLNSLKKQFENMGLDIKILPTPIPSDLVERSPFLSADMKEIKANPDRRVRTNIVLTLENRAANNESVLVVKILKILNEISKAPLILFQGKENIGEANIKIDSIDNKQNQLLIKLSSFIFLRRLYYDV